ncbi:hypothetical protein [Turicibacter sp. TJ11]|uniref:hypothetical protein n=1 Tax=Turicibacter sp. TJ11 TaxID=2806443 RepID=UPI001F1F7B7C|nr:hypothetical protein [Turicibacter sp. TJ11]
MKKIISTISLSVTALLVVFVLQYNSGAKTTEEAMTIAGLTTLETLYEKKTEEGSILLYRVPGEDQISLAFLNRDFSGYEYVDGTIQYETTSLEEQAGITYVTLRQSDDLPYTIYAGVTTNPDLYEVLVTEPTFNIAHSAKVFESDVEGVYIWMAYSPDFKGESFTLIGLSESGEVVGDLEQSGTELTIHSIDTSEAH